MEVTHTLRRSRPPGIALAAVWSFVRRRGLLPILGGLLLKRQIRGSYVLWVGGFPKPAIINRGGVIRSGGIALWSGTRLEVAPGAELSIGKGTYLNRNTTVVCHDHVTIGRGCAISWDVVITDSDEHDWPGLPRADAPVVIEDNVWIGCRAIILKGVTIGTGAVVAAGAIVTRDVPPRALVAGQPARVVRRLDVGAADTQDGIGLAVGG